MSERPLFAVIFLAGMFVILAASQFLGHHLERKRDREKADLRRAGDEQLPRSSQPDRPASPTAERRSGQRRTAGCH